MPTYPSAKEGVRRGPRRRTVHQASPDPRLAPLGQLPPLLPPLAGGVLRAASAAEVGAAFERRAVGAK